MVPFLPADYKLWFSAMGLFRLFLLVAFVGGALGCGGSGGDDDADVRIGALLDLSGVGSSLGQETESAIQQAIRDAASRGVRISVDVRDTGSDPARAAQEMQSLVNDGIVTIVGPQTSSELRDVLPIANAAGALVVSSGSTASSLALPNDAAYRLVPTDEVESSAVFELMSVRGRTRFVTVNRADAGNQGLANSLKGYAKDAGRAVQAGVVYPTSQISDFSDVAQAVAAQVEAAGGSYQSQVGVFIAGFGEVSELLKALSVVPSMVGIALYAGDGSAQVSSIVDDAAAAGFASQVDHLPSALTTIPAETMSRALEVTRAMGREDPNAFALGGYDAVGIFEKAYVDNGSQSGVTVGRVEFEKAARNFPGVTGTIVLNEAGDRASAPYAFWGICSTTAGAMSWRKVGEWVPRGPSSKTGDAFFSGCQ